jgi:hypothetical protein
MRDGRRRDDPRLIDHAVVSYDKRISAEHSGRHNCMIDEA